MGFLGNLLGNVGEASDDKLERELAQVLVVGEQIEKGFQLFRDLVVFTNKRMIMIDKQGLTGKKKEYHSVPYQHIRYFAMETKGRMDTDAEIKIELAGRNEPISLNFGKDKNIIEVYQVLGTYVLK